MSKATEKQKQLLIVLLMVMVLFAAYQFGYRHFSDKAQELQTENEQLQSDINLLRAKVQNEEMYQTFTAANKESIKEIIAKFGPGVTPEKSILFFIALCEQADMEISAISFGEPGLFYSAANLSGEDGQPMQAYRTSFGITYTATYEGLKQCIDYINQYPERMNITMLTAAYNSNTAGLSGTMSIDWYSLTGTGKEYTFPELEQIDLGNDNIFRSGNMAVPEF